MQNPEQAPMDAQTPQPAPIQTPAPGMTPPVAPKPKSKAKLFIVLGLILAIVAGALLYFFVFKTADDGGAPPSLSFESSGLQGFIGVDKTIKMTLSSGETYTVDGKFLEFDGDDRNDTPKGNSALAAAGVPLDITPGTMIYFPEDTPRGDVIKRSQVSANELGFLAYTVSWEPSAKSNGMIEPFHLMPESVFGSFGVTGVTETSIIPKNTIQAVYFAKADPNDETVLSAKGLGLKIHGALDGSTPPENFSFDETTAMPDTWYLVTAPHRDLHNFVSSCKDEVKSVWYQTGLLFGQFEKADLDNFAMNEDFYFAWIKTADNYSGCSADTGVTTIDMQPKDPVVDPPPIELREKLVADFQATIDACMSRLSGQSKCMNLAVEKMGPVLQIMWEKCSADSAPIDQSYACLVSQLPNIPEEDFIVQDLIAPAESDTTLTIPGDLSRPTTTEPDTSTDLSNDLDTSLFAPTGDSTLSLGEPAVDVASDTRIGVESVIVDCEVSPDVTKCLGSLMGNYESDGAVEAWSLCRIPSGKLEIYTSAECLLARFETQGLTDEDFSLDPPADDTEFATRPPADPVVADDTAIDTVAEVEAAVRACDLEADQLACHTAVFANYIDPDVIAVWDACKGVSYAKIDSCLLPKIADLTNEDFGGDAGDTDSSLSLGDSDDSAPADDTEFATRPAADETAPVDFPTTVDGVLEAVAACNDDQVCLSDLMANYIDSSELVSGIWTECEPPDTTKPYLTTSQCLTNFVRNLTNSEFGGTNELTAADDDSVADFPNTTADVLAAITACNDNQLCLSDLMANYVEGSTAVSDIWAECEPPDTTKPYLTTSQCLTNFVRNLPNSEFGGSDL